MADASSITCAEAAELISEVSASGCRSPWEMEMLEIALLNRISDSTGGAVGFPLTADLTSITADVTTITADETQF
jgi:hypothetical protein